MDLAREILKLGHDNLNELGRLTLKDLTSIKGIGEAKAVTIAAALELGRRRMSGNALQRDVVAGSKQVALFLREKLKDLSHEIFAVIYLNLSQKILGFEILSEGGITGTVADPRIILRKAIEKGAVKLILCHNHPSGSLKPSRADEMLTSKMKEGAKLIDIDVIDHIIVSEAGYFSFADEGLL